MDERSFRTGLIKTENDINAILSLRSNTMEVGFFEPMIVDSQLDRERADACIKELRSNYSDKETELYFEAAGRKIYMDPNINIYHRFYDVLNRLQSSTVFEYDRYLEEGNESLRIWKVFNALGKYCNIAKDDAYEYLQKFGVADISKDSFRFGFDEWRKPDAEAAIASVFRNTEFEYLRTAIKGEEKVYFDEVGRTGIALTESDFWMQLSAFASMGTQEETDALLKRCDKAIENDFTTYFHEYVLRLNEYLTYILVLEEKLPKLRSDNNAELLFDFYLDEFIHNRIILDDFTDVLLTIISADPGNAFLQERISQILRDYNLVAYSAVKDWASENEYYYPAKDKRDFCKVLINKIKNQSEYWSDVYSEPEVEEDIAYSASINKNDLQRNVLDDQTSNNETFDYNSLNCYYHLQTVENDIQEYKDKERREKEEKERRAREAKEEKERKAKEAREKKEKKEKEAKEKKEREEKERREAVWAKLDSYKDIFIANGEYLNIDFTYNFRKRMKALLVKMSYGKALISETKIPGYDFTPDGINAIPDSLKDIYKPNGDYILYAKNIAGYPLLLTDRRLYLNNVEVDINGLQQMICYNRVTGNQVPSGMYYVELCSTKGSKYTVFPKGYNVDSDANINVFALELSAALMFNRDPQYKPIENYSSNNVYICLRCHDRGVYPKGLQLICPNCGKMQRGNAASINPMEEQNYLAHYIDLLEKNLSLYEDCDFFQDEEDWRSWAQEELDKLSSKLKQTASGEAVLSTPNQVICPKCGKALKPGSKFCNYCGTKIEIADIPKPSGGIICPKCGKILKEGSKFCNYCGSSLVNTEVKS